MSSVHNGVSSSPQTSMLTAGQIIANTRRLVPEIERRAGEIVGGAMLGDPAPPLGIL